MSTPTSFRRQVLVIATGVVVGLVAAYLLLLLVTVALNAWPIGIPRNPDDDRVLRQRELLHRARNRHEVDSLLKTETFHPSIPN